jgi:hypothetical protein
VQRRHADLRAEHRIDNVDRLVAPQLRAVALESRFRGGAHDDVKVAGDGAASLIAERWLSPKLAATITTVSLAVTPEQLSAFLAQKVKRDAESCSGGNSRSRKRPVRCVPIRRLNAITVPPESAVARRRAGPPPRDWKRPGRCRR